MAAKKKKAEPTQPSIDDRIDAALAATERAFGRVGGTLGGKHAINQQVGQVYSTGSLQLDMALGVGGVPGGRVIEIYGKEASGKTTMAINLMISAQRQGRIAAFIDAEHALDLDYATHLGLAPELTMFYQPDYGEQALQISQALVDQGIDMIVIDSVAALVPKAELEGELTDSLPGAQARMMSKHLRMITPLVGKTGATVIFLNQVRSKIGVMFGSPNVTSGGNALKFYASVRLDLVKIGGLKKPGHEDKIGDRTRATVMKNKVAPPFRSVEFDMIYGEGICKEAEIIDLGIAHGLISKSGAWFDLDGQSLQGRWKTVQFLREHKDVAARLEEKIRAAAA